MRVVVCSCGGFTRGTLILMLVLVKMLAGSAAGAASKGRLQGDDSACLKGLVDVVREGHRSTLVTWTATALGSPCNYTSTLKGITCNNSRVVSISLPSSDLIGALPDSLSSCYFLHTLELSSNSLSGPVPPSLGALSLLSTLSLSNNHLSGPIPFELSNCSNLSWLDLSGNQLSGSIPPLLGLLPLLFFNVSNNKLAGNIPTTLSNTSSGSPRFNASSFANNPNLYGYPLNLTSSFPTPSPPFSDKRSFPTRFIVILGLATGFGSFILSSCAVCLWVKWRQVAERKRQRLERHGRRHEEYRGWNELLRRL